MRLILLVGTGSFLGGICRYLLSIFIQSKSASGFPYGTLMVNLVGCFLIGCLYGIFERWQPSEEWRLLFITGILGGFTTFSAFSGETFVLIKNGFISSGLLYVLLSVSGGIGLTFLGVFLFKTSTPP